MGQGEKGTHMSTQDAIAAEWWEKHSGYRDGADHARRIREGDHEGLGYGQFSAIVAKGAARGKAMGLSGDVGEAKATRRGKSKGSSRVVDTPA